MSYGIIDLSAISAVGDAIRSKAGTSAPIAVSELAQAIVDLPTGGGGSYLDCYNTQNMSGVVSGSWLAIDPFAFHTNKSITGIDLPNCSMVASSAVDYAANLQYAILPKCEKLYNFAFWGCTKLSSVFIGGKSCYLEGIAVFSNSPMLYSSYLGYFGSIYVNQSYLINYRQSASWSYYIDRLVGISVDADGYPIFPD